MREIDRLRQENAELHDRLAKLSQASLLITRSLDLDDILQGVVDGACLIADARYGALLVFDEAGAIGNVAISGLTPEEVAAVEGWPDGEGILGYLNEIQEPLRLANVAEHPRSVGVPRNHPPMTTFLGTALNHLGRNVGNLYLANKNGGGEFTHADEAILVMFASQAALAISNALNYSGEQQSKASWEALVDLSPVGVMVFDAKTGNLTAINQEAQRIARYRYGPGATLEDIRNARPLRYMDGRDVPWDQRPVMRTITSGAGMRAEEFILVGADSPDFPALFSTAPAYSDDGAFTSVILVVQDLRPREELERLRAEFLGIVSHELRAPLTTIKGSAATALGSTLPLSDAETRQFFRLIDEQADHMRNLINDLLDMTRIESGMLSVTTEPTDLAFLVDLARNTFLNNGARNVVEVDLAPGLPRALVDRQRMLQVLNNLLSNASKFSPDWSTIKVSARQEDVHVMMSVTDSGQGLIPEQLDRLFRKFSQLDDQDAGRRRSLGEGLGLAICKGIVESHGGRIWAESGGPGQGTRFTFTVPVADESASLIPISMADGRERTHYMASEQTHILAIDDDPQTLWYLRNTLSDAGYVTVVAGNQREVENVLASEKPELVLLDLMLQGTDGFELLRRVPAILDVPVIFLSGNGTDENITRALEMGADDYIVKPFSPTELVARIRASLRKRAASEHSETLQPYTLGELTLDYADRSVTVAGRPVGLTATEYRLLYELSLNAGRVLTHNQLLERVWGPEYSGDSQLLRSFVKSLRNKLGDSARQPSYIFTEPRVGYRLAQMPQPAAY